MSNIFVHPSGKLIWGNKEFRCAIGRNGVSENKQEGDGTTPAGCFPIREILYRDDRLPKPTTPFLIRSITSEDGWCDNPEDPSYNKPVKLPYPSTTESLWREDNIYDLIAVLGYNDAPPVPGKGSAIFMHVTRPNYTQTNGCIALTLKDLLEIIESCDTKTQVSIQSFS